MTNQKFTPAYPAELRERGVPLFREHRGGGIEELLINTRCA